MDPGFHPLAAVNSAAMNAQVWGVSVRLVYTREWNRWSGQLCVSFFEELPRCSPQQLHRFTFLPVITPVSVPRPEILTSLCPYQ